MKNLYFSYYYCLYVWYERIDTDRNWSHGSAWIGITAFGLLGLSLLQAVVYKIGVVDSLGLSALGLPAYFLGWPILILVPLNNWLFVTDDRWKLVVAEKSKTTTAKHHWAAAVLSLLVVGGMLVMILVA